MIKRLKAKKKLKNRIMLILSLEYNAYTKEQEQRSYTHNSEARKQT